MSFRDNLQHLRARNNMTQEQLAMLLGVSRQSVTKWESEKAYPEMDKLLKLCHIFSCTLDELVQGDIPHTETSDDELKNKPAVDVFGYNEQMKKYAWQSATGCAVYIFGVALCAALSPFLFQGAETSAAVQNGLPALVLFAAVALGSAFLIYSRAEHRAFIKAHPFLEDFYSQAEKDSARRSLSLTRIAGIGLSIAGLCVAIFQGDESPNNYIGSVFLFFVALGVWIVVWGSIKFKRFDLEAYNNSNFFNLESEEVSDTIDIQGGAAVISSRAYESRSRKRLIRAICFLIMALATIISLCWLFISTKQGQNDPDYHNMQNNLFWLPWLVGSLLCAAVSRLMNAVYVYKHSEKK